MKIGNMFGLCLCIAGLTFCWAGCGGGSSDSGGDDGGTEVDLGDPYSDDSEMKSFGVGAAPPLYVNPETPNTSGSVSVVADIAGATTITFTASGNGCGTIASTSGANPLTVTGTAGTSGYCDVTATATVDGSAQTYGGHFEVLASDSNLPPASVSTGMWRSAAFPAGTGTGAPTITSLGGPSSVLNGSSNTFTVNYTGSSNVSAILVQIGGYNGGYFYVPASGGSGTASFDLTLASDYFNEVGASIISGPTTLSPTGKTLRSGVQSIIISIIDALNRISEQFTQALTTQESGTGDVKVSISWDSICDVDLHVTEPGGETIYYGNTSSSTGGELDVDMNVGCGSGGGVENIYWPEGQSPQGDYSIMVHMYKSTCGMDGADIPSTSGTLTYEGCGEEFKNGAKTEAFTLGATGDQITQSFTSLCSYSVAGTAKYEDFPSTDAGRGASQMVPSRLVKVKVLRHSDNTVLGEGYTGADGKYNIPFTNDGEHGYYVQVVAERDTDTLKQQVMTLTGTTYAFVKNESGGKGEKIDESTEPNKTGYDIEVMEASNAGALNIWDVGVSSAQYTRTATGTTPQLIKFYWTKGSKPGGTKNYSYYSSGSTLIAILGDAADPDEYDDMVIAHEYGHFINDKFSTSNSPGGTHYIDRTSVPTLAWGEGWATFFGGAAYGRSTYIDTNAGGVGVSYSFETLPYNIQKGNDGAVLDGNVNEANVTAVLWDLYDTANETKDNLGSKSSAVWTVFTTYLKSGYANFNDRGVAGRDTVDFLDGWFCLQYGDKGTDDTTGVRGIVVGLSELSYDFPDLAACTL